MSELSHLETDLEYFPSALRGNTALLNAMADNSDPQRRVFCTVSVSLGSQILYHAAGVAVLVSANLVVPLYPVERALLEALANLRYLTRHDDRHREATIYQAFSFLADKADFADDSALVDERDEILARLPPAVVAEAKRRKADPPRTWSGLSFGQVAQAAGITEVQRLWRHLSRRIHSGRVGHNVMFGEVRGEKQDLKIEEDFQPHEAEALTNFARRALHSAFRCLWGLVDSPPIKAPTPDPEHSWQRPV